MIQSPLSVTSEGYLCPGPYRPLAIATSGYICLVVVVEVEVPISGGGGKPHHRAHRRVLAKDFYSKEQLARLHREDDEVLTVCMVAVIYGYLE